MNNIEKRVNDLEIKFSYQDELVNQLNLIVASQQKKIDEMVIIIKGLSDNAGDSSEQNSSLNNERPPHY